MRRQQRNITPGRTKQRSSSLIGYGIGYALIAMLLIGAWVTTLMDQRIANDHRTANELVVALIDHVAQEVMPVAVDEQPQESPEKAPEDRPTEREAVDKTVIRDEEKQLQASPEKENEKTDAQKVEQEVIQVDEQQSGSSEKGQEPPSTQAKALVRSSSSSSTTPKLRLDWTKLKPISPMAKRIHTHQHDCSLPWVTYRFRKMEMGLGSDLHVWSQALKDAMAMGARILTHQPPNKYLKKLPNAPPKDWAWLDQEFCNKSHVSQLDCYFPQAEPCCGAKVENYTIESMVHCNNTKETTEWRQPSMEFLFSPVSPIVYEEAKRQLGLVFPHGVPQNLVVAQVRWGDKWVEKNELIQIEAYIAAINETIVRESMEEVHVLLCTEDPKAVEEFKQQLPDGWHLYLDQFYTDFQDIRQARVDKANRLEFNVVPRASLEAKGKIGLWALGSLLVAMEGTHFVIATMSNWSRLINELRKAIVNPRCNNCTTVVDMSKIKFEDC